MKRSPDTSRNTLDPLAQAFLRRGSSLRAVEFGTEPMALAAAGLAMALIEAAEALGDEFEEPVRLRA